MHSQVPRNYDYHDHDADDVKNVHCALQRRHAQLQFEDAMLQAKVLSVIEAHPTSRHLAIHNYQCVDCGPVLAKIISLKQDEPSSLQTVT